MGVHREMSLVVIWFPYISPDCSELISVTPHESCEFAELAVVSLLISIIVFLLSVRGEGRSFRNKNMTNVSNKQFMPMNKPYAQLDRSSVQADKPLELAPPVDSVNKFLKDGSPAPKENSVLMNKESLEKLFAMFEFVVKAMRSMLAGMGVFAKLPGELDAQPQVRPGVDGKSGLDGKATVDAGEKTKGTLEAEAKVAVKPGSEVIAMQDKKPAQLTISPDGKLNSTYSTTSPNDLAQRNRLSSVTVQVQNCHCPHTDEKVAPQPSVTPALDKQPSRQSPVTPGLDTTPSPQPPVTPPNPDLTSPAPDDLVDDFSGHSQTRFDNHRANRPSPRSRF